MPHVLSAAERYVPASSPNCPALQGRGSGPALSAARLLAPSGPLVSFLITYALGLLALWLYETRSLFNFCHLPLIVFSGQLAPLALLPPALKKLILWTPFPYTLPFPTDVLLGRTQGGRVLTAMLIQILWIVLALAAASAPWRGGVRRFAAFGI